MEYSVNSDARYNLHVSLISQEEFESFKENFKPMVEERALKIQSLNAQEAYLTRLLELKKQQIVSAQPITAQVTRLSSEDKESSASSNSSDLTKNPTSQGPETTAGKFSGKLKKFKGLLRR